MEMWHSCRYEWRETSQAYAAMNNTSQCFLTAAGVPARLEPPGLLCWQATTWYIRGILAVWKVFGLVCHMCMWTLLLHPTGAWLPMLQELLEEKYFDLLYTHTNLLFWPRLQRIRYQTGEEKVLSYLIQHLSIAVQWGKAVRSFNRKCCSWILALLFHYVSGVEIFCKKLRSFREGQVKVWKQGGNESTLGYPTKLHNTCCKNVLCNRCSAVFLVFLFCHLW